MAQIPTEGRNLFIESWLGLITQVAKKVCYQDLFLQAGTVDDAIQEAVLFAIKKLYQKLRSGLYVYNREYVRKYMSKAIYRHLVYLGRTQGIIYMSAYATSKRHKHCDMYRQQRKFACGEFLDQLPARENGEGAGEGSEITHLPTLKDALASLDEPERQLLQDLYWRHKTFQVIGEEHGCTRQNIHRKYNKIKIRLRRILSGPEDS